VNHVERAEADDKAGLVAADVRLVGTFDGIGALKLDVLAPSRCHASFALGPKRLVIAAFTTSSISSSSAAEVTCVRAEAEHPRRIRSTLLP